MGEEHARRAVHLRNDNTLCAVHNKCTLGRHERDIAHIHILLFNIFDRARACIIVNIKYDEAHFDFQRCSVSNVALLTFLFIKFRFFKNERDIFQNSPFRKITNRENRVKHPVHTFIRTPIFMFNVLLEELIIGGLLNLDQVRHTDDFRNPAEALANTFLASECKRHQSNLCVGGCFRVEVCTPLPIDSPRISSGLTCPVSF